MITTIANEEKITGKFEHKNFPILFFFLITFVMMTKLPRLHSKLKNNIFMFAKHNCYHILIHITGFPLVRNISWKNHRISIKLWLCKLQILQICCFVFKITNNQITYTYYYYINSITKFWRIKTDTLSNIITKKINDLT